MYAVIGKELIVLLNKKIFQDLRRIMKKEPPSTPTNKSFREFLRCIIWENINADT